jgi:uncharacterized membrane protein
MTRDEYIKKLEHYLRKLPKVERQEAVAYYREYFQDAGVENEASLMEELGSPQELAKKIMIECVERQFDDSEETSKENKGLGTIWIILLAICALPMSPVVLALVIVLFVIIGVILLTIGIMILSSVIIAIAGIPTAIAGVILVFTHPANAMIMFGSGVVLIGIGILLFLAFSQLWNIFIKAMAGMGHALIKKVKKQPRVVSGNEV